ncbi:Telomerase reverse transcriptase [Exaiptasia diaphana]|nr:Telomerase reverse transcriptase [Exaiptasia diaphana]
MEVDEKLAFQENESKKKTSKKRKRNTSSSRTRKPAKKRRLNDSTFKASSNPELQSSPSEHKSRVVNRHFFRQSIMYSTNLKDKFPKKHIMETTAANSSGVTRLIRAIFIDDDIHEKDNNKKKGLPKKKKPKIQRLPRRYLNMRELFKTFLLRHKRCKFADLLKRYCKVTRNGSSIHEQQMSPSLFDEDEPDKEVEEYKTAVNNYTKTYNVCRFVKAVCDTVIPAEFWGTDANKRAFYKSLQRFIMMQKDETFSLLQMGHKIKVKSCDWLKLTRNKGGRIPVTESEKQKEVFYRWLWWLVRNYIMVILKAFFYITEGASQSQDIFYYRKPTWRTIQSFGIKTVTTTMLSEISEKEAKALVESKASLGYSRMRFLPKASSVRPIVNMKVSPKISGAKVNLSINSKLRNVFEIMRFENARKPARSDSTMFGVDDVYKRIKSFVATRENHDEPLYFVHVDINKCFDSILLDRLFHIMKAVFKEEEYSIRRFAMIKSCQGKVKKVFEKSVALGNDCRTFKEFAEDTIKEKGFRNMILIDQVYYPRLDLQQVLATLKKHLFGNIVMIGSNFYRQNRGV